MAVVNQPDSRNILYCHTPPRYIYDQRLFYLASLPVWQRPAFLALIRHLKPRYEAAVARMDRILVNSENVQRRVKRYLGRASIVVPPPCEFNQHRWQEPDDYYLSTARLDSLKRVDLVIETFKQMPDKKLVVVSGGPERRRLEALAMGTSNIVFLGEVSEKRLTNLVGRCIATIYVPRDEDFGMSPVESMAAGKPVIGVSEGGLLETVVDGQSGVLLPADPGPEDLEKAVHWLTADRACGMRESCEQRAQEYRTEIFLDRMRAIVNDL
jgi:glycosyltransferase involved in cell wall biosynthesis